MRFLTVQKVVASYEDSINQVFGLPNVVGVAWLITPGFLPGYVTVTEVYSQRHWQERWGDLDGGLRAKIANGTLVAVKTEES